MKRVCTFFSRRSESVYRYPHHPSLVLGSAAGALSPLLGSVGLVSQQSAGINTKNPSCSFICLLVPGSREHVDSGLPFIDSRKASPQCRGVVFNTGSARRGMSEQQRSLPPSCDSEVFLDPWTTLHSRESSLTRPVLTDVYY